jgi:hypothetical protein
MGRSFFAAVVFLVLAGCQAPPTPSDFILLDEQARGLARMHARDIVPERMGAYAGRLASARTRLDFEKRRFILFRDFDPLVAEARVILGEGASIAAEVKRVREARIERARGRAAELMRSAADISTFAGYLGERKEVRKNLMKAGIALDEAARLVEGGDAQSAERRLDGAERNVSLARAALAPLLERYTSRDQIALWKRLVDKTIAEARATGCHVIVIDKLARTLTLYRGERTVATWRVGLGRNGSHDKLRSGDNATPEGRYRITKKNPRSRYYKALLIDYPNDEDRARFAREKKRGRVAGDASIGGLVEIHGGGSTSVTQGCVSLSNEDMDDLYEAVSTGTPVTIVGTTRFDHELARMAGIR